MKKLIVGAAAMAGLAFAGCQDNRSAQPAAEQEAQQQQGTGGAGQEDTSAQEAEQVDPHTMGGTEMEPTTPPDEPAVGAGAEGQYEEPQLQDSMEEDPQMQPQDQQMQQQEPQDPQQY